MTDRDAVFLPLRELAERVRARQVSPAALTRLFLDRLERLGPRYHAVVTLTAELAESQARQAEREIAAGRYRGPLHGIPYGLKDLFATACYPTTWGAGPLREQAFDYDATIVRKLQAGGAVLAAKLALVELAGGARYGRADASFTGPGLNPWDRGVWSGGSSTGSGAAVAAGLVPFAIGTETWGSILVPACCCGVSGLRPTFGRVSRHGGMPLTFGMDKPGPICLTADDCGLVLEAIAGHDRRDEATTTRPYRYRQYRPERGRFRLAVPKGVPDGSEPGVRDRFREALAALAEVAEVEEVELPDLPYAAVSSAIFLAESASVMEEIIESGITAQLTAPEGRRGVYPRTAMLATDYLRALRLRRTIAVAIDRLLERYDALVSPTQPKAAPPADRPWVEEPREWAADPLGAFGSCVGLPAISVPMGFTEAGLPAGLQILGRAYDENVVLAVAAAYQELTDWHTRHPPDVRSRSIMVRALP